MDLHFENLVVSFSNSTDERVMKFHFIQSCVGCPRGYTHQYFIAAFPFGNVVCEE